MKARKLTVIFLAAVLVTASTVIVNSQNGIANNALVGTWKVRITPGAPQQQFDELMTFTEGGGIVESNNYPFFQLNLTAGPGQGSWAYEGRNRFGFTFVKFLYTPQGQAAGTLKVNGVIVYSPGTDTWSSPPANVSICDSQVNNCNLIDQTRAQATRLFPGS